MGWMGIETGRPRLRWRDGVERYMWEGGVSWEEGRQMTEDSRAGQDPIN